MPRSECRLPSSPPLPHPPSPESMLGALQRWPGSTSLEAVKECLDFRPASWAAACCALRGAEAVLAALLAHLAALSRGVREAADAAAAGLQCLQSLLSSEAGMVAGLASPALLPTLLLAIDLRGDPAACELALRMLAGVCLYSDAGHVATLRTLLGRQRLEAQKLEREAEAQSPPRQPPAGQEPPPAGSRPGRTAGAPPQPPPPPPPPSPLQASCGSGQKRPPPAPPPPPTPPKPKPAPPKPQLPGLPGPSDSAAALPVSVARRPSVPELMGSALQHTLPEGGGSGPCVAAPEPGRDSAEDPWEYLHTGPTADRDNCRLLIRLMQVRGEGGLSCLPSLFCAHPCALPLPAGQRQPLWHRRRGTGRPSPPLHCHRPGRRPRRLQHPGMRRSEGRAGGGAAGARPAARPGRPSLAARPHGRR